MFRCCTRHTHMILGDRVSLLFFLPSNKMAVKAMIRQVKEKSFPYYVMKFHRKIQIPLQVVISCLQLDCQIRRNHIFTSGRHCKKGGKSWLKGSSFQSRSTVLSCNTVYSFGLGFSVLMRMGESQNKSLPEHLPVSDWTKFGQDQNLKWGSIKFLVSKWL